MVHFLIRKWYTFKLVYTKLDEDKRMLLTAFNDIFREEKWNAKF